MNERSLALSSYRGSSPLADVEKGFLLRLTYLFFYKLISDINQTG